MLPADVDAYIQALNFFASIRQSDAALSVWRRLISLGKVVDLPRTFPFFDELILDDRSADARQVWIEALTAAGLPREQPLNHSLVWNGGFSGEFSDGGLGWRWNSPLGVAVDFDTAPPSSGARAVRLDFGGGSNLELTQPMQYVPVEPRHTYHFHANMRTEEITTESGMRFAGGPESRQCHECLDGKFRRLSYLDRRGPGRDQRPGNTLPVAAPVALGQPLVRKQTERHGLDCGRLARSCGSPGEPLAMKVIRAGLLFLLRFAFWRLARIRSLDRVPS